MRPKTCSPAKPVDKESDGEGAEDASDREDGHGNGPDGRQGGAGDLFLVALKPCLVDKILNDLTHTNTHTEGGRRQNITIFVSINTKQSADLSSFSLLPKTYLRNLLFYFFF